MPAKHYLISPFNKGYAVIRHKKKSRLGVIDQRMKVVVEPVYEKIMIDSEGNIHVW
jgi:hypothetical protein